LKTDTATVVALATPEGEGGLAVVRLSGHEAVAIARRVAPFFGADAEIQSHRAVHGHVIWPPGDRAAARAPVGIVPGDALDEVVVLPMLAPRSYTGEDTIEFFCHGGRMPGRLVTAACQAAGAVAAPPGEFTRRAFLNGKLSLDQAEAVADLIAAADPLSAKAALRQVRGGLDAQIAAIEGPLHLLLADLEGSLEFVADERVGPPRAEVARRLRAAAQTIDRLISLVPAGRQVRDGISVVLVGPPNAGKSSLFNALLGEDRVIVDPEAGTTRDVVTATLRHEGLSFVLHDTAGLHPDGGRVERAGMQRTVASLRGADVVVNLTEASVLAATDTDNRRDVDENRQAAVIEVATKIDLLDERESGRLAGSNDLVMTSSVTGVGLAELKARLIAAAEQERIQEAIALGVLLNARHQDRLEACRTDLDELITQVESRYPGDEVVASMLGTTLSVLGEISGRVHTENLLATIFDRFCVGK